MKSLMTSLLLDQSYKYEEALELTAQVVESNS